MGVRTYPDTPRVYFDFDGTLADLLRAAEAQNMPVAVFKRLAGAFLNLPVMPGAVDAVDRVLAMGLQAFGLTKIPSSNPYAATEKLLWAARHLPQLDDKVIIASDKGAVGTARDFLVDDMPGWANANNFPGTVIHFKGDWAPVFGDIERTLAAR
jgi:hypothetical protein